MIRTLDSQDGAYTRQATGSCDQISRPTVTPN